MATFDVVLTRRAFKAVRLYLSNSHCFELVDSCRAVDIFSIFTDLGGYLWPRESVVRHQSDHDFCRYRNSVKVFYCQIK